MRDPVTAQTVHSEGLRPQPREAKTVSHLEQSMMTRVTFRMHLIQLSKRIERKLQVARRSRGGTTRQTWPLDQKKAEETIPRRDEARATDWPNSLFGGNEKVPPCFKVAGYQK